jgi:hypothetical protein
MILVDEKSHFYCFAKVVDAAEKNSKLLRSASFNAIDSIREKLSANEAEYFEAVYKSSQVFSRMYNENGLGGNILENYIKSFSLDSGFENLLCNPTDNSKHPADFVILSENKDVASIKYKCNTLIQTKSDNKTKNDFWSAQCARPSLAINAKGLLVEFARENMCGSITLSRNGKNQDGPFDKYIACEKINGEFGENGIITHILVVFRSPFKDEFRHVGVAFPSSFFTCEPDKFIRYPKRGEKGKEGELQAQLKWIDHTEVSYLTINPSASHQLVCCFSDLVQLVKISGAVIFYDSMGVFTCD